MKRTTAGKLLLLLMFAAAAPAWAVFKCESGGKVSYTDSPCDGGKVLDIDAREPAAAAAERRHAAHERQQLKSLERERHKREAADERDLKKASRESVARHKKCAAHAQRQKLAREDVARATGLANEKARRKEQRVTDAYEAECGRWYERELGVAR